MKIKDLSLFAVNLFLLVQLPLTAVSQEWPGIRDSIYSDVLKEQRKIQVVIPKDYQPDSKEKYEVLYVLDGEWYMQQIPFIYNFVVSSGYAPPCIIVLLPNTYVNGQNLRDRDFSPTRVNNVPNLGGADNFHSFLKNELIPYIENKYPASGIRSLVGSSFSGLFSVYSFVKDPELFQSFVASDPNLNWDKNYITKLAAEKLGKFSERSGTLFIAGLTQSFRDMGIAPFDSVLRAKAPTSIRWKCLPYPDETHYSVQHKAFYDGFRFSHLGYSKMPLAFHPMNGVLEESKPVKVFVFNEIPSLHYSTDNTEPTSSSPTFSRGQIVMPGPGWLKIKSFPNRPQYHRSGQGNFQSGEAPRSTTKSKSSKTGLKYNLYEGNWESFPKEKKSKAIQSGNIDEKFNINSLKSEKNLFYDIKGSIDIPEDAYYIFYSSSKNGAKVSVGDKILFETDGTDGDTHSFVVPLKKGTYPVHLEFFRKKDGDDIHFRIFRTKPENENWWQTEFFKL